MKNLVRQVLVAGASTLFAAIAVAAETTTREVSLTGNTGSVATPGIGKIILAFVVTLGVGVAIIYLLRRLLPWLPKMGAASTVKDAPRVISSGSLQLGLKLHVVEVRGVTVLVAEGKSGIAMMPLPQVITQTDSKQAESTTTAPEAN